MRRIAMWFAGTATIVILLFGYHTSTNRGALGTTDSSVPATSSADQLSGSSPAAAKRERHRKSSGHKAKAATTSFTGKIVQTSRGPVEVKLKVRAGKIIGVSVPIHPDADSVSQKINAHAVPLLVHETMSAQSDKIDMISGATITSGGYVESLQSALDKAGI
ncbi:MAG: FMN-binding protein [Microlunatus sp.]|nr:FMN-binding protein [Microlunatus sp.]